MEALKVLKWMLEAGGSRALFCELLAGDIESWHSMNRAERLRVYDRQVRRFRANFPLFATSADIETARRTLAAGSSRKIAAA